MQMYRNQQPAATLAAALDGIARASRVAARSLRPFRGSNTVQLGRTNPGCAHRLRGQAEHEPLLARWRAGRGSSHPLVTSALDAGRGGEHPRPAGRAIQLVPAGWLSVPAQASPTLREA